MPSRRAIVLAFLVACEGQTPPAPSGTATAPTGAAPTGTAPTGTARTGTATPPPTDAARSAPGSATAFGLYVLALTWSPSFCCAHQNKEECADLAHKFAATHLTLHGLWPNYTDEEAERRRATYPEFCGTYQHCKQH